MGRAIRNFAWLCLLAAAGTTNPARAQSFSTPGGNSSGYGQSPPTVTVPPTLGLPQGGQYGRYQWDSRRGFEILPENPAWKLPEQNSGVLAPALLRPGTGDPTSQASDQQIAYPPTPARDRWTTSGARTALFASFFLRTDGLCPQAAGMSEYVARIVDRMSDDEVAPESLGILLHTHILTFGPTKCRPLAERMLRLAETRLGARTIPAGSAHLFLARIDEAENKKAEALVHAEQALLIFERRAPADSAGLRVAKQTVAALSAAMDGDAQRAAEPLRPALERQYGTYAAKTAAGVLADSREVFRNEGLAAMVEQLEAYATARTEAVPVDIWSIAIEMYFAEAHVAAGKPVIAKRHLERALALCRVVAPYRVPNLLHLSSLLETLRGDGAAARAAFDEALTLTGAQWGTETD
jgi:hypothetical protein